MKLDDEYPSCDMSNLGCSTSTYGDRGLLGSLWQKKWPLFVVYIDWTSFIVAMILHVAFLGSMVTNHK